MPSRPRSKNVVSSAKDDRLTLAHVTHEAVEQLGGIGAVLEGMITSPVYQAKVKRSILVGPTSTQMAADPRSRLGEHGEVFYSSIDNIDTRNFASRFRPIEWAFNVTIVYGKRYYDPPGLNRKGEAEVLLIDVTRINNDRLNLFKWKLGNRFGLESWRYEAAWDFEEYVRLAEPAFYALLGILRREVDWPCVMFSHEFMGMPACLQAILEGPEQFRTVFHAHECSTARRIVEDHPGHDTMFYNAMAEARKLKLYLEDVFGSRKDFFRHALISRASLCDGLIAVGDKTAEEFRFLSPELDERPINLVYNGLPVIACTADSKNTARGQLQDYAAALLGHRPDVLMTHVTRPVISKAIWRDFAVCHELDRMLGEQGKTGVLFVLTTGGGARRPQDVLTMEQNYGWPRNHRQGYPDLVGPEVGIGKDADDFNARHRHVQVVLVNQFGWSQARIGQRLAKHMNMADLRRATDIEFGMATYEPFGISPLEPLSTGAICVVSNVCGCKGFVDHVTGGKGSPNVLVANFTKLDRAMSLDEIKGMSQGQRDQIEHHVAWEVAQEIMRRLPTTDAQRQALIRSGQAMIARMGWDQVLEEGMLPLLHRIRSMPSTNGNGNGNGALHL